MCNLVVTMLQLSGGSTRNHPSQSLAIWFQALGGGVFSQAFSNKLPHANQVSSFNLKSKSKIQSTIAA